MSDSGGAGLVAEALGNLAMGLRACACSGATVRSDSSPRSPRFPASATIARPLLPRPMAPEGIREAITGPSPVAGVRFESNVLVDTLVASTPAAGGGLPLLQFARSPSRGRRVINRPAPSRVKRWSASAVSRARSRVTPME